MLQTALKKGRGAKEDTIIKKIIGTDCPAWDSENYEKRRAIIRALYDLQGQGKISSHTRGIWRAYSEEEITWRAEARKRRNAAETVRDRILEELGIDKDTYNVYRYRDCRLTFHIQHCRPGTIGFSVDKIDYSNIPAEIAVSFINTIADHKETLRAALETLAPEVILP